MAVLALYTFGIFARPAEDPANDGFRDLNDPVFATVDRAPGLIARSGYASDPGPQPWGPEVYPRAYHERGDGWSPATLSLWTDAESVWAFTYSGLHAAAMRRGRDWFHKPAWPPYALWWHDSAAPPDLGRGRAPPCSSAGSRGHTHGLRSTPALRPGGCADGAGQGPDPGAETRAGRDVRRLFEHPVKKGN